MTELWTADRATLRLPLRALSRALPGSHAAPPARPETPDAIDLLLAEQAALAVLFAGYRTTDPAAARKARVARICGALRVRMQVESEIFLPAMKAALRHRTGWAEILAAHAGLLDLLSQLERSTTTDDMFDARLMVLSERVRHEARDAQAGLFPAAEAASIDLHELGARMAARMDDLRARAALADRHA